MEIDFKDPKYYTNRELSWVLFDYRVLNEARDKSIPLFERLKFLSITASNLDEFFMIRVASLKDMENAGYTKKDIAGMTPTEQLKALHVAIHELVDLQYSTYNRSLLPLLEKNGLHIVREHEQLTAEEATYVDQYFQENVYPVLTPMAVDSSRPFPLIRNKSLNIGAMVRKKNSDEELEFATVQVPSVLSRVVRIPSKGKACKIILLEEIIERNMDKLFLNYDIVCAQQTEQEVVEVETVNGFGPNDVILDIRSIDEQEDKPLKVEGIDVVSLPFYKLSTKFGDLDQNKTWLLWCERGVMSRLQALYLREQGFNNVKVYRP